MRIATFSLALPALLAAIPACSGGDDEPGRTTDQVAGDRCESDDDAEPFVAGMSKTTPGGLSVAALSADPAPPAQGRNRWTLEIKDASGTPLPGATVQVTCTMFHPGGSHGCPATPSVSDKGDGKYEAYPITFNMPGHWELSVGVTQGNEVEEVTFPLCID